MSDRKGRLGDWIFTLLMLMGAFGINLLMKEIFDTQNMIPIIFVLAVFLIARKTSGYLCGISASLAGVLAMNYAFTYPYYAFDLISPECVSSAIVMLVVSVMTGTLTTQIKEQDKVKADAEKERMRGNLLRAVSHDLRTPLTAIYGACSTLIDNYDHLDKQQHLKLLSDIRGDASWLVRMVENLLSVTRVDDKSVKLAKQDTVLEELVDAVMVKFRKHYPDKTVQVSIPEEFVSIPVDAMLTQQVLMNLLENAVFHAKGMKNLWLTVEIKNGQALFRIEDDGCGIPEERLAHIFSGFQGTDPSDKGRSNMGIGLSVCSAIVKAHGGRIWAKNRIGGGTEFLFTLDLEDTGNGEQ